MLVEKALKGFAGFGRYLFQRHALMADDDALLRVALHIDDGIDVNLTVVLLKTLYHHLYGVGYLFVLDQQDLLADNL